MRTKRTALGALAAVAALGMHGCSGSDDPATFEVAFLYTPAGSSETGAMVERYTFHCRDILSLPGCDILYFEDVPHQQGSGEWMGFPDSASEDGIRCSEFVAVVTDPGGAQYTFYGWLQAPASGGGLLATGIYDKSSPGASESGAFTASAERIHGGTGPCSNR